MKYDDYLKYLDDDNIGFIRLQPIGGDSFVASVPYSIPPKVSNIICNATNCFNKITIYHNSVNLIKLFSLLSERRVQNQINYFYNKYLYIKNSNSNISFLNEAKREISGQIRSVNNRYHIYGIENSLPLIEVCYLLLDSNKEYLKEFIYFANTEIIRLLKVCNFSV